MPYPSNDQNSNEANNMPSASLPATDDARYAALATEVRGLDSDYKELKGIVVGLDRKIEANALALSNKMELMVNALGAKVEASITGVQSKLDERSRIPWQAWSVMATVIIAIGALVYWPIRESTARLSDDMGFIARRLQDTRELVARHDEVNKYNDARLNAISGRLAEHIRDVTRIDRGPR